MKKITTQKLIALAVGGYIGAIICFYGIIPLTLELSYVISALVLSIAFICGGVTIVALGYSLYRVIVGTKKFIEEYITIMRANYAHFGARKLSFR